jgi:flavin-dependent dehydrogenase
VKYPKLLQKAVNDVVVVGAGIAGLTVAYNLVKEGKKVVVPESGVRGKIDRDDDEIWQQIFLKQILSCNKDC